MEDTYSHIQPQYNVLEVLQKLGIEEYADRIFHSNSHGELFHLDDYYRLYELYKDSEAFMEYFPVWFRLLVDHAEKNVSNPEAVFQHVARLWIEHVDYYEKSAT